MAELCRGVPGETHARQRGYARRGLIHYDLKSGTPAEVTFAVSIDGAPIPSLFAKVPLLTGAETYGFRSAPLLDAAGNLIGMLNFDFRRISAETASNEMATRGLWTSSEAAGFANTLGAAMVAPILSSLRVVMLPKAA